MKKETKIILNIIARYALALIFSANLWIFYYIFKPLVIYPLYFILSPFYIVQLESSALIVNCFRIDIIEACVAGAAFYALLMLNLLIPLTLKKRIKVFFISALILLFLNIARIILLTVLFVNSSVFFETLHYFLWYFLSTLFVFGIWIWSIKKFKIHAIPFYTDFKYLKNLYSESIKKKTIKINKISKKRRK